MENSANKMVVRAVVLAVMVAVFSIGSDAQFFGDCRVSVDEIQTCEPAVIRGTKRDPSKTCCSVLAKADLPCLCTYKTSPLIPSNVDIRLAMELPGKCSLKLPSRC
ncbi:hypothetical protein MLD38_019202 [Melastoma candidum]|uniref:Uncharacterized protein n=2 Tax=Melastoma candidum TaxID=119954 RepID=A0ACB9QVF0_9MYRT|nr:hypothetical protein MLD38_019200 [Melastoma candidum]KAI4370906.1 hypothetical protein MLD38_019202 [Melastoma candidum]